MRATQQLNYAIYGIFDLAYHGTDRPTSIQEIVSRQRIPARYLEQIFRRLRHAGLILSKRGPGGGYLLARPPDQISLAEVVTAVQGGVLLRPNDEGGTPNGSLSFVWDRLEAELASCLESHTIAEICGEAMRRGVERVQREPATYQI